MDGDYQLWTYPGELALWLEPGGKIQWVFIPQASLSYLRERTGSLRHVEHDAGSGLHLLSAR
jgi:hypothetical protein